MAECDDMETNASSMPEESIDATDTSNHTTKMEDSRTTMGHNGGNDNINLVGNNSNVQDNELIDFRSNTDDQQPQRSSFPKLLALASEDKQSGSIRDTITIAPGPDNNSGSTSTPDMRVDSACTVLIRGERSTKPIRGVQGENDSSYHRRQPPASISHAAPRVAQQIPPLEPSIHPFPIHPQPIQDPVPNDVPKRETEREGFVLGGFVSCRSDTKLHIHPNSDFALLDFVQHYLARDLHRVMRKAAHKVFRIDHNSIPYRCHLVEETDSSSTVQLIDYGDIIQSSVKLQYFLPLDVLTIPPLAVSVVIENLSENISKGTFVNVRLTSVANDGGWNGQLL